MTGTKWDNIILVIIDHIKTSPKAAVEMHLLGNEESEPLCVDYGFRRERVERCLALETLV